MEINFVNGISNIVCGFMSRNGKIYEGKAFNDFTPIVEEFQLKDTTKIIFEHNKDVCLNIDTYNRNEVNKNFTQNVINIKKLDITANDINIGATEIVLNFTDMKLVVYNKYNIPHMLLPLDNEVLKNKYKGKVVFLTIHRLNNPNIVSDAYSDRRNFLVSIKEQTKYKLNINNKYSEFNAVVDFAIECWDKTNYLSSDFRSNTINVITAFTLDETNFIPNDEKSPVSIAIVNKNLLITRNSIFDYIENPNTVSDIDLSKFKEDILPGNKIIFIIDNENILKDRYFNQFGETQKVPKIKNKQFQDDGLYVVLIGKNFMLSKVNFIPIDKIDECDFIYQTQEEASLGADKTTLFEQKIKEKELQMQHDILKAKKDYELMAHKLKKENEELRAQYELREKENEHKYNKLRREVEYEKLKDKRDFDRYYYNIKNEYEQKAYERDSVVETLKTVGAIAGVISTGVLLFNKFSK